MNLPIGNVLTMSSREIADLVKARHDNVKRTIERLAAKGTIRFTPSEETSHEGPGSRLVEVLLVNKRDSFVVVAQLCPEFTAALVDRWQYLEQLQSSHSMPQDYIQALEHLLTSKKAEQAAIEQRDHAVRTKAEIGNRREATAMATASAAVRQANQLRNELGKGCQQATVTAVEIALNQKLGKQAFRPLKNWCDAQGIDAAFVQDARYGRVRAWPAAAWLTIYNIDLATLFDAQGGAA